MSRMVIRCVTLSICILTASQTACHRGATGSTFLSLFGLQQRPLVVALVARAGVLDPFTPHEALRKSMSADLDRQVRFDLCLPVQLAPNLQLGFYDLAIVTAAGYADMPHPERFPIIAATVDELGKVAHPAVLVVPADSPIQTIEELRAKKVGFGPSSDARTHHAGLSLLKEHGIRKPDLSLALLPVPGSLWHYPTMRDVALAIQNGSIDAGFIDEEQYDQFDEASEEGTDPARNRLRIIGRTKPVPDFFVIHSPKAKPELVARVSEFLMSADEKYPEALRPLLLTAYHEPDAALCAWSDTLSNRPTAATDAAENPKE